MNKKRIKIINTLHQMKKSRKLFFTFEQREHVGNDTLRQEYNKKELRERKRNACREGLFHCFFEARLMTMYLCLVAILQPSLVISKGYQDYNCITLDSGSSTTITALNWMI